MKGDEWQVEEDLVLKKGKVYVLKDKKLKVEIIWLHHNVLVAEYRERWKIIELVTRNDWWSDITKDIKKMWIDVIYVIR